MIIVTNWKKMVGSATWFPSIVEHYTEEAGKKRMGHWAYLFFVLATSGANLSGIPVLFLLLLLCKLLSILGVLGNFL